MVGRRSAEPREISAARRRLALPIECSSILGVAAKQIARGKFSTRARMDPIHLRHELLYAITLRITKRSAAKDGKTGPKNHSVVRVLWAGHDLLFEAARSFIDDQERQAVGNV